jgi:hypothetical protein
LGVLLLGNEEFEVVIMMAVATEEMHGSPENDYERAYRWKSKSNTI